jgi:hypothetical protein
MSFTRVIQDGVEFYTLNATGKCGVSESGVARLCGVSHQAITKLLNRVVATKHLPKSLQAFAGRELRLQLNLDQKIDQAYTRIAWIEAEAVAAIIEYYAFDARRPTEAARFAYRKFARMGIERWIQGITNWRNDEEPVLPDVMIPHSAIAALNQNSKVTKTAYRLYLEIQAQHTQNLRPAIAELCQTLTISRPTYHKALKILDQLSLLPDWVTVENRRQPERFVRNWLWEQLGGQIEAPTPDGPIDLLTPEEVIEVKAVQNWKEAIGHVLCKAKNYPDRYKCLLLFGEVGTDVEQITKRCEEFDIQMGFIEIEYCYDPETDNITIQLI